MNREAVTQAMLDAGMDVLRDERFGYDYDRIQVEEMLADIFVAMSNSAEAHPPVAEIVEAVLRDRRGELAYNVTFHNVLIKRLKDRAGGSFGCS